MRTRRFHLNALTVGLMLLLINAVVKAQEAPVGSTPIPAAAGLAIGQPAQADGTKFLLLVNVGGVVLKYVARREDLNTRIARQLDFLKLSNQSAFAAIIAGRDEVTELRADIAERLENQKALQQELTKSRQATLLMLGNVRRPPAPPAPPPAPAPALPAPALPAPAAPVAVSPVGTPGIPAGQMPASGAQLIAEVEAAGPQTAEDVVTETDPFQQGLLKLPIPAGATVSFDPAKANEVDGSRLNLVVTIGGLNMRYRAAREDWAIFQHNALSVGQKIKDLIKADSDDQKSLVARLEEKRNLIAANVSDLEQAMVLSNQNTDMLAMILKAQKRSKLERFIEQIPSIAGIIAIAITKIAH